MPLISDSPAGCARCEVRSRIQVFRNFFESFGTFLIATFVLLGSVAAWAYFTARKEEKEKQEEQARRAQLAAQQKAEHEAQRRQQEIEDRERKDLLQREHEARRPICAHCGKKTLGVFRHTRIDGTPDRRYHDNPVLCNQCYRSYQPVRPWNLPSQEPSSEQGPRGTGEA